MMARKPRNVQPVPDTGPNGGAGDSGAIPIEEREPEVVEDELVVGKLVSKAYEPGTMSAPAFIRVTLDTKDGEVTLEAKSKLAQYITLLNNGERVGFFVEDGWIVGVA